MAPRILILQHHRLEHPGVMTDVLRDAGATLDVRMLFDGAPCPDAVEPYGGVLVMGGPMSVWDEAEHPWLAAERAFLAQVIRADLPTLGVCLGAQMIAAAAGAAVARGPVPEIGWYRITPVANGGDDVFRETAPFVALEWHRDVFALPPGALALARSARYPVQAFRLGLRVYGTLFHLEIDAQMIAEWCVAFAAGTPLPAGDAEPALLEANARAVRIAKRLFLADV
jgi:GMP synthase-like glutamine amidotransferase